MTLSPLLGSFGTLSIAIANSINARRQLEWQREQFERGQELSRENAEQQRQFQWQMQEANYARQLQNQADQYSLSNSWPLRLPPAAIVSNLLGGNSEEIPLNLIIAPAEPGIQKKFGDVWGDLARFIQRWFALNGSHPVIALEGAYKPNFVSNPNNDILAIYQGLKGVPTLFIAPYSTENDSTLGITMAMWGMGFSSERPVVSHLTWNLGMACRKLLREEASEYRKRISDGRLSEGANPRIEKNEQVFRTEGELLAKGNSESDIEQFTTTYSPLRAGETTFVKLGNSILPSLELFSAAIGDLYWSLTYNKAPRLPLIIKTEKLLSADSAEEFIDQYAKAIAGASGITPRQRIDAAADFNALGFPNAAKALIADSVGVAADGTFIGDMSAIGFIDRESDIMSLVPEKRRTHIKRWAGQPRQFGSLELELLRSGVLNPLQCREAAQECHSLGRKQRAFDLFRIAALNGDSEAMCLLGVCYYLGDGCAKDPEQAKAWFRKSAAAGNAKGREYLENLQEEGLV